MCAFMCGPHWICRRVDPPGDSVDLAFTIFVLRGPSSLIVHGDGDPQTPQVAGEIEQLISYGGRIGD